MLMLKCTQYKEFSVGKKISDSSKKSILKKQVGFKKLVRSPAFIVVGFILVITSGYFAYKTIHYYSAPAEIKLIRTLPIYDYESDNLKIVSRSEDYGGTDWKNVYSKPMTYIYFGSTVVNYGYRGCTNELVNWLKDNGWSMEGNFRVIGGDGKLAFNLSKKGSEDTLEATIFPSELGGSLCYVSVSY